MRRFLLLGQGLYYLTAGLWPIIHMRSFLAVTGPKTDLWLVRTVGSLIAVNGATMILAASDRDVSPATRLMCGASAGTLAAIDFTYSAKGRISPIYAADGVVESVIAGSWLLDEFRSRS
jgi:hypothetical protein